MLNISKHRKLFLLNLFIETGSFTNLKKLARPIYDEVSRNKPLDYKQMSVTEYLEHCLLPHRKISDLDSKYLKYLYSHYARKPNLYGSSVTAGLETRLKNTAVNLGLTVDEVKKAFDNNLIFPELTAHMKSRLRVREYNSLLTSIAVGAFADLRSSSSFDLSIFQKYETFDELCEFEPRLADFIQSRVPNYGGVKRGCEQYPIIYERGFYYGVDLQLSKIRSIHDDLLHTLRGNIYNITIPPYLNFRLKSMIRATGNLNRIGFDSWNLLRDLDLLALNTGFDSIKEMLEAEGYAFKSIQNSHLSFIPSARGIEIFFDNYDENQVLIDPAFIPIMEEMDIVETLQVEKIEATDDIEVHLLTYTYKDNVGAVHTLLSKSRDLYFKNRNSLDLTAKNIIAN